MIRIVPRRLGFLIGTLVLSSFIGWCENVVIYPVPEGIEPSPYYDIEVIQNGESFSPFVYCSEAQLPKFNQSKSTSYSVFSFEGEVTVRIQKLDRRFTSAKVLPSSYGIETKKVGEVVEFVLSEPKKIAVEFDGCIEHPLLLFADLPEVDVPNPTDPNVIYFGPGIHDPEGGLISPESGQTVYLAGGAIVNAHIKARNVNNVTVRGKGILSGRKFGHTHGRHIHFTGDSSDITVKDITIVDSPGFYVTVTGPNAHVQNIKGLGWWFNTDGVSTGENGLIEDCFLKCNDDAIKVYRAGTKVYRTTIWQMENGAPFQISWNMNSDNSGFHIKDCDVIHCDHIWDNTNTAVFTAIHGGGGHMSNYLFEDIRIENCDWRLFSIQIFPNKFARSDVLGEISDLTFRNISVETPGNRPLKRINLVQGWNESRVGNTLFENLSINGLMIDSPEAGRFELEPTTTYNIRFEVSKESNSKEELHQLADEALEWENPLINKGLNSYGQKDFHIYEENGVYYLTATEVPNNEWGKRGIILYQSTDLIHWQECNYLINRRGLGPDVWYRDEFQAPEIHKINGKNVLIFSGRNDKNDAYGRLGIAIATADHLKGPYEVLNQEELLVYGNNPTLLTTGGKTYCYWDLDGRFYTAELDVENGRLMTNPVEMLGPKELGSDFRFLDAPFVMEKDGKFVMISSSFYAGYVIRVRQLLADQPTGPWKLMKPPLMTWLEDEADMNIKMPWPSETPFAPPTQVVFHHQIFKGPNDQWLMAYHSSEKYSEPYLILEPVQFGEDLRIELPTNKQPKQRISLK